MKKISILICLLILISCNSKKSNDNQKSDLESDPKIDKQVNTDNNPQYIIVKVSDRNSERIEETDDFSPAELRTTRLRNGKLITTFKADLGSFDEEHNYGLELSFIRNSEKPALELSTYRLVSLGDGVKLQPQTDIFFESINTFNLETFNDIKAIGAINDYPDQFYAPLNEENILVIKSTEDLIETENSTDIISEHFQRVKGHLIFNIIKIKSGENYSIRVDFNIINEIRVP